jgi:SAM-dependent methyltransferase
MLKKLLKPFRSKGKWGRTEEGMLVRHYRTYEEYVSHQKAKLVKISNLDTKWAVLKRALGARIAAVPELGTGTTVLCLGARLGAEVEFFIERGAFAIGIDLNPGPANRYVVSGDFHALQYADASVDIVYTNSLDHVFDLKKVLSEVKRVLKPDGVFIADIVAGIDDEGGRTPGAFGATWWTKADDVIGQLTKLNFRLRSRAPFTEPWNGVQAVLQRPT